MTDPTVRRRGWRRALRRGAPAIVVLVMAAGVLIGPVGGLALPITDSGPARAFAAAVDDPAASGSVLVAFDPDAGTYAEIRPAVRAALAKLVANGATLAFISFTPDGRALALAELDRLARGGVEATRLLDLGFRAGAEAGMIDAVRTAIPATATGALADSLRTDGGGIGAFEAALVVGGTEIGPRSWVEQVLPRVPELPLLAVVPTLLGPTTTPYLRSGQVRAVLATARDDAAFVELVRSDPALSAREATVISDLPPSSLAILLGMLVTLLAFADAIATRLRLPSGREDAGPP